MNDFKLKLILSVLGGIIFSFFFIILAFVVPAKKEFVYKAKPVNRLEEVSRSFQK